MSKVTKGLEDGTAFALFDLFTPTFMGLSLTKGPGNEPAQVAGLEAPGRAVLFPLLRTTGLGPARPFLSGAGMAVMDQKQDLAGHVFRDIPPALFIAVHGLQGNGQKPGQFLLGQAQLFSIMDQFLVVHGKWDLRLKTIYHNVV
jgi:hypothetical protein